MPLPSGGKPDSGGLPGGAGDVRYREMRNPPAGEYTLRIPGCCVIVNAEGAKEDFPGCVMRKTGGGLPERAKERDSEDGIDELQGH